MTRKGEPAASETTGSRQHRERIGGAGGIARLTLVRAAGVAGDDPAAVATIAGLVDRIGYDPVRLGSLRAGRVLEPGGPVFGVVLPLDEFERAARVGSRSLA
jgi:hypothetical protein